MLYIVVLLQGFETHHCFSIIRCHEVNNFLNTSTADMFYVLTTTSAKFSDFPRHPLSQKLRKRLSFRFHFSGCFAFENYPTLECLERGITDIRQMVPQMYKDIATNLYPAAARSVLAHLEHMVGDGRVHCDGKPHVDARYTID